MVYDYWDVVERLKTADEDYAELDLMRRDLDVLRAILWRWQFLRSGPGNTLVLQAEDLQKTIDAIQAGPRQ